MDNSYEKRLKKHISSLETAYDNVVSVLNEDLKKDENDNLKIKDTEKKIYAEGIDKLASTADDLIKKIRDSKNELIKLKKPKKEDNNPIEEEKEEVIIHNNESDNNSNLNQYLKD